MQWCLNLNSPILWHSSLIPRQRAELEDLRRQLEENNSIVTKALKEEYEKGKEEQERRHQVCVISRLST